MVKTRSMSKSEAAAAAESGREIPVQKRKSRLLPSLDMSQPLSPCDETSALLKQQYLEVKDFIRKECRGNRPRRKFLYPGVKVHLVSMPASKIPVLDDEEFEACTFRDTRPPLVLQDFAVHEKLKKIDTCNLSHSESSKKYS